jgi:hypothetical protein
MAFARYPHAGTITYITGTPTMGSTGIYVPGTSTNVAVNCRVEAKTGQTGFIIDEHGARVEYAFEVFCPKLSFASSLQDGQSKFHYSGKELTIINVPPLQRTTVLRCK